MINFYLKNFLRPNGKNCIREMFHFESGTKATRADGTVYDPNVVDSIVDDGVRKLYPAEYAEFRALVDANRDEMYAAAIAESKKEN